MNDTPTSDALDAEVVDDLLTRCAPVTILDVRTPAEFASAHIPGSYNVPLDLLPEHASAIGAATGEPVVLVCRSGARARQAEQALRSAQLPRLHILDGGLSAWDAAGLPLNRGRPRWILERQVRGVAGTMVLAGALGGLLLGRRSGSSPLLSAGAWPSPRSPIPAVWRCCSASCRTTAMPAAMLVRSFTTWRPAGS